MSAAESKLSHDVRHHASSRHRTTSSYHQTPSAHRSSSRHCSSSRHSTLPSDVSDIGEDDLQMRSDVADSSSWPVITNLVYSGRNKIDLKPQSKHIKELLHMAVEEFRGDLFFLCTFPNLSTKTKMLRQVLRQSAKALDLPQEVRTRLKEDPEYNEALGAVVRHSFAQVISH